MHLFVTYIIPLSLVLIGSAAGSAAGQQLLGSVLGLVMAVIYILVVMRGDIFMIRGTRAIKAGNIKKGLTLYEKAIKNHTKNEYVIYACYMFLRYGEPEKCVKYLETASALKGLTAAQKAELASTNGLYLWKVGRLAEAEAEFKKAHEISKNSSTYSQLGFILLEEKKLDEAMAFNTEAMEYNDSDPSIMDNMAMTYLHSDMPNKALELYEKIMEKGTRMPVIYYNYAVLLEKLGRLAEAEEALTTALRYKFSYIAAVSRDEVEKKLHSIEEKL